jgi:hypothetical protein
MECLIQYLDEIEDLIYAVALKAERILMALKFLLFMSAATALQVTGILVALRYPPIALAMASLLSVGMLYHGAVNHSPNAYAA